MISGGQQSGVSEGSYRAPAWLPGAHLQTIYPAKLIPVARVDYRRERWASPDGDFIDVDFVDGQPGQPLVVLFHGLEGSSGSHYARALMDELKRRGWWGAVPHFRSCSGEMNHAPRFYHSGDTEEIGWILHRMNDWRGAAGTGDLFLAGASLGGNALLRWLAEQGTAAGFVSGACSVSAPLCLNTGGRVIARGFNRIYTRMFLQSLVPKCLQKLDQHPGLYDREALLRVRSLYDFDNVVTAPLHGFKDTDDYWTRCSAGPMLTEITVPTLVLNAQNDPFLPAHALPTRASAAVTLEYPREGGHVGFATGGFPGKLDWLPQRMLTFFNDVQPAPLLTRHPAASESALAVPL